MGSYFLFPFAAVDKNSRVVLYGAGEVGRCYHHQMVESGYCTPVLWVDKRPDGVKTVSPEAIAELAAGSYDVVLLAILSARFATQMKETLLGLGVPEEKICAPAAREFWVQGYSDARLANLLETPASIHGVMRDYFTHSEGQIEYFTPLLGEMRALPEKEKQALRESFGSLLETELTENAAKLVLLRLMFEGECFSPKLMELFLGCIGKIRQNPDEQYWLVQDLSRMVFLYPAYAYGDFYVHRQELLRQVAEEYAFTYVRQTLQDNKSKRVCFVVHTLIPGELFPCTRILAPLANEFVRQGWEVRVVPLDFTEYDATASFLKPWHKGANQSLRYVKEIRDWYNKDVEIVYPQGETIRQRQQAVLDAIYAFGPRGIIDASDEGSVISWVYSKQYPTVYIPMRTGQSSSFFHKTVHYNKETDPEKLRALRPVRGEQIVEVRPFYTFVPAKRKFVRKDYGLAPDDFVMVTVGDRLVYDLSPALMKAVAIHIEKYPRLKWILVGEGIPEFLRQEYPGLLGSKILHWGYEEDLTGLYGMCDVYLNPERTGGGTTIAWAMQHGLGLATNRCDGAGAGLAEEFAVEGDEAAVVAYVVELMNCPDKLADNKKAMKEKADGFSLPRYVNTLVDVLDGIASEQGQEQEKVLL